MAYEIRKNKKGEATSVRITIYRGIDENGKRLPSFTTSVKIPEGLTKKQAEKFAKEQEAGFKLQCKFGGATSRKILFRDFAKEVMEAKERAGRTKSTLSHYQDMLENRILPYMGHIKIDDITPSHLNNFYKKLRSPGANKLNGQPLSDKTILEHHRLISTIFEDAVKQRLISFNPAKSVTAPTVVPQLPNYYQPAEIEKIKQMLNEQSIKWKTIGYMLMVLGARRGEIAGIKRSNINFEKNEILISTCVLYNKRDGVYVKDYPKGRKYRVLPIPGELKEILTQYLAWLDREKKIWGDLWKDSDYIFVGEKGGIINPDNITQELRRISEKYKKKGDYPYLNPHAFRHTVASMLISKNIDVVTVAGYLGDVPVTISNKYAHVINDAKIQAGNKMCDIIFNNEIF